MSTDQHIHWYIHIQCIQEQCLRGFSTHLRSTGLRTTSGATQSEHMHSTYCEGINLEKNVGEEK